MVFYKKNFQKTNLKKISLTFLVIFALRNDSYAVEPNRLIVDPTFQEVVIKEHTQNKSVYINITNTTSESVTFSFEVLDIRQIDDQGNIGFVDKPKSAENPYAWFIEVPPSIELAKDESKQVEFTIKNSADLSPGGHYVAVVAKTASSTQASQNAVISPALSSFFLIRKEGGEVYQLSLRQGVAMEWFTTYIPDRFELILENQGNVHTAPTGTIEVKDIFGKLIHKGIINDEFSFVLPGARRTYNVKTYSVSETLPIMLYTISLNGKSVPGDISFAESVSFIYVSPIFLVVILLFSVLGTVFIVRKLANRLSL